MDQGPVVAVARSRHLAMVRGRMAKGSKKGKNTRGPTKIRFYLDFLSLIIVQRFVIIYDFIRYRANREK